MKCLLKKAEYKKKKRFKHKIRSCLVQTNYYNKVYNSINNEFLILKEQTILKEKSKQNVNLYSNSGILSNIHMFEDDEDLNDIINNYQ